LALFESIESRADDPVLYAGGLSDLGYGVAKVLVSPNAGLLSAQNQVNTDCGRL